jgi:hypothetical protein
MTAAPKARSYDDYVTEWRDVDNRAQWAKGDLIAALVKETFYGEGTMTKFAESVEEAESTLYTYKQVAEAYPRNSRRREIPWSVYKEFVKEDDRLELVKDWTGTVRQARELLAARKAPKTPQWRDYPMGSGVTGYIAVRDSASETILRVAGNEVVFYGDYYAEFIRAEYARLTGDSANQESPGR